MTPIVGGKQGRFGTFAGVFTPSVLTILGIILFQRLGYVVGSGGLIWALGLIAVATTISVTTSLSLSAIATNIRVKGGGDYFLISRTLGMHFGGAIGLVLFLAQAVSVAFYCIGFGEAVAQIMGRADEAGLVATIAGVAAGVLGLIAFIGADLATKFQYVVMVALGAALVSFFAGAARGWSPEMVVEAAAPAERGVGFWPLFAIFFPAVTGFTQGVSMSGDLKDPAKSLPRGTFWAVGLSTVVYVGAALALAGTLSLGELAGDYAAMRRVAVVPWLVDAGVIAATLSSAMASFLGAPRILQSLAADNVIPVLKPFAAGSGPGNNPRRGVMLAGGIALGTIALGNLNAVAAVVGMCFLLSYGLLNYATFFEARAGSPSFRPTFKMYNAWLSLAGAALCLGAGVAISPVAAALAGAMMVALHQYLRRTAPQAAWADSRYAYHFRRVRDHLMEMREGSTHPRDWRPHVLALCNDPMDRARLLRFASWIDGESGLTTAARILVSREGTSAGSAGEAEESLREQVRDAGLETFVRVVSAPSIVDGLSMLSQAYGLGPLRANTILMSAHEHLGEPKASDEAPPAEALDAALRQRRNIMLLEARPGAWERTLAVPEERRVIDVWWRDDASSRLSLLLAHLMTRSEGWRDASIRVLQIVEGPHEGREVLEDLAELLRDVRIDAEPRMVEFDGPRTFVKESGEASVVFLPLRIRSRRLVGPKGQLLAGVMKELPVTALVIAGEDIDLEAEPDEPAAEASEPPPTPEGRAGLAG